MKKIIPCVRKIDFCRCSDIFANAQNTTVHMINLTNTEIIFLYTITNVSYLAFDKIN